MRSAISSAMIMAAAYASPEVGESVSSHDEWPFPDPIPHWHIPKVIPDNPEWHDPSHGSNPFHGGSSSSGSYVGGAVGTNEVFQYGRFITRMKVPQMPKGTVASFFTYWSGPGWYEGGWNEIDIEIPPSIGSKVNYNLIYGENGGKKMHGGHVDMPDATGWNIHQIDWTPEYIKWYLNGELKRTSMSSDTYGARTMNKKQKLHMNFWTPSWSPWGDGRDDSTLPWYVHYDYVEVYSYNSGTKGFDMLWKDDFNTFDKSRWWNENRSPFQGSLTSFDKSHAYIDNGELVLKLTKNSEQDQGDQPLSYEEAMEEKNRLSAEEEQDNGEQPLSYEEAMEEKNGLSTEEEQDHGEQPLSYEEAMEEKNKLSAEEEKDHGEQPLSYKEAMEEKNKFSAEEALLQSELEDERAPEERSKKLSEVAYLRGALDMENQLSEMS